MVAKRKGKAPISSHPVFPVIVALWFATLFGLGSLVLPAVLFEKLFIATGISSAIPAAAPPLGVTARILIALVATGIGVAAGLFIARKIVASQGERHVFARTHKREQTVDDPSVKKPISAHEELGTSGLNKPEDRCVPLASPMPDRRRPLSVTDDSGISECLDEAPLPGEQGDWDDSPVETGTLELAEFRAGEAEEPVTENGTAENEFDSASLSVPLDGVAEGRPPAKVIPEVRKPAAPDRPFAGSEDTDTDFEIPPVLVRGVHGDTPVIDDAEDGFELPGLALEFGGQFSEFPADEEATEAEQPKTPQLANPALAELSMSELVDRFALSLQQASEDAEAARKAEGRGRDDEQEAKPVATEAPNQPAVAPTPYISEALHEFEFDATDEPAKVDDDDELEALSFHLPAASAPRPFSENPAPHAADIPGNARVESGTKSEDAIAADGYSSLLDLKGRLGREQEFVGIEDEDMLVEEGAPSEPVVVFPGQEKRRNRPDDSGPSDSQTAAVVPPLPATPEDESAKTAGRPNVAPMPAPAPFADPIATEHALRDALEKLQRMSGAA